MEFSALLLARMRIANERTYASSTMSRYSGAETKSKADTVS